MNNFFIRKFIRDYENINDSNVRKQFGYFSSIVGIVCNIVLLSGKFLIGFLTNSISIISDGFNNLSDCASCVVTMFGYKVAAKPADKDHPFGHGRMEYLISMVIAMVIMVMGCELLKNSFYRVIKPVEITFSWAAFAVLVLSVLVKIWLGIFNLKLGKRINSNVMLATSKDSFSDVFATAATLIALIASLYTKAPVDGIMGMVVSVFILISGYGIIRETVDQLLGKPADPELVERLKEMVSESMISIGMHDLIIHSYGPCNLIGSVHVEVDSRLNIMDIHDAIDELERNIYDELNIHMTIHMDPIDYRDENTVKCKHMLDSILKYINPEITIHDLRVVAGITHTNLIFDLLIPYDCDMTEKEIKQKIDAKLAEQDKTYYAVITFDKSYY